MDQSAPAGQQPLPYCVPCPPAAKPRDLVADVVLGVVVGFAVQSLVRWMMDRRV